MLSTYVIKQNMMYIREKTVLESIMYEDYKMKTKADVEESNRCTYVITKFAVCVFPRAFAFRPGFKYNELFDFTYAFDNISHKVPGFSQCFAEFSI